MKGAANDIVALNLWRRSSNAPGGALEDTYQSNLRLLDGAANLREYIVGV